ncbi:MAG TPA: ChrR family anti-sigma-E factor [Pseudolabrys sp.]|nr:ChrR family anti-sigma-E factor [Pseudolabrys sp.]
MTVHHHPSDETLAAYTAGTLDLGRRLVVASHLERCGACAKFMRGLERVAGTMLDDLPPTAMSGDALTRTLGRIDSPRTDGGARPFSVAPADPDLPACLRPYDMGRWRWIGPGVEMRSIVLPEAEDVRVFLLKGAPGTRLPQHSHSGSELTSILVGSYAHEGGHFGAGDFEEADENVEHRPIVGGDETCICLVALEGRLKLSGFIGTLLNPFVRL